MKVDVAKIEGYDSMTAEQKVAALEGFEVPDPDYSGYVRKDLFDKTASELSEMKKKQRDALSEEERKKAEADERFSDLQSKYDALLRESTISKSKAQYLSIGYSEELAEKAAAAVVDGDTEALFEVQKLAKALIEENLKKELIKGTSKPVGNGGSNTMTLESFRKLTPGERATFAVEHPEEYKLLYGGN